MLKKFCLRISRFHIENKNGLAVGTITKMWRGALVEALTDMDTYKIEFPENSDVNTKVLLMGAAMLMVNILIYTSFDALSI